MLTLIYWSDTRVAIAFDNNPRFSLELPPTIQFAGKTFNLRAPSQSSTNPVATGLPSPALPIASSIPGGASNTSYQPSYAPSKPTNVFPVPDKSKYPSTNLTTLLSSQDAKDMQSNIIPKEGVKSAYGLTFSLSTFSQMQQWSKSIAVDSKWKGSYDLLATTTYHPCCGAPVSTNDCGHAIAMTGLIKKMLQDGKSEADIKTELLSWEKYFFPRHYVIMGLALKKLGQDLNKIDLSPDYSTVQVEQNATNYLIY